MADAHANFAYATVATAPSPATSGTSLVVAAGKGAIFPAVPFNATICPVDAAPLTTNAEIVRVTNIATDTFTITRTQEGTSARTVIVGDSIFAGITAKVMNDADEVPPQSNVVSTAPLNSGLAPSPATITANDARAARVTIPLTGVLHGLSWFVGVQSGNIDLGIYDTSPTTRNRLYSSGSTACAAANTWQSFDPSLAVTRGDELDFVWAVNNGTASIHRLATVAAAYSSMPDSSFWTSPLGGGFCSTGVMAVSWSRASTFPLPSTLAESGLLANGFTPIIIARIAPS